MYVVYMELLPGRKGWYMIKSVEDSDLGLYMIIMLMRAYNIYKTYCVTSKQ